MVPVPDQVPRKSAKGADAAEAGDAAQAHKDTTIAQPNPAVRRDDR
jgi:hypothetical protein